MTTTYDIQYKVGDTDTVGAILKQNDAAIDLTGYIVSFRMKNTAGTLRTITCSLGGVVNGTNVPGTSGGITAQFTASDTAVADDYNGEFVMTNASGSVRIPSGNNYIKVKVWDAI